MSCGRLWILITLKLKRNPFILIADLHLFCMPAGNFLKNLNFIDNWNPALIGFITTCFWLNCRLFWLMNMLMQFLVWMIFVLCNHIVLQMTLIPLPYTYLSMQWRGTYIYFFLLCFSIFNFCINYDRVLISQGWFGSTQFCLYQWDYFKSKPLKLIYGFWSLDICQILVGL